MRRIGLAFSVIDRLSRIWSQRHLSLTTKCRLYSSCILAVLLYACETWTLTKSDWKRLESQRDGHYLYYTIHGGSITCVLYCSCIRTLKHNEPFMWSETLVLLTLQDRSLTSKIWFCSWSWSGTPCSWSWACYAGLGLVWVKRSCWQHLLEVVFCSN